MQMSTHAQKLERWLGAEQVAHISEKMRGFHGGPIPLANVPGRVWVGTDGDFHGPITAGGFAGLTDRTLSALAKNTRAVQRALRRQMESTAGMGFSSLSDLISEATTGGKRQQFMFAKTGVTGVANVANSLYDVGANPPAGAISSDGTGTSPTNDTAGAIPYTNPTGGDTMHITTVTSTATVGSNNLLLYDLYYKCIHNLATDPQAISDVPSRYQSTSAKGTFMTAFVTTALGAGTPTYTITYMDQDGNTAEDSAAFTIVGSAIARRFPFAASVGNGWFLPFNSGDTGARKITNLNLSATSTGKLQVQLCKPLVWIPQGIANFPVIVDGINSAFNLVQVEDSSAMFFMEINKGATTATSYSGMIVMVAG